LEKIPFLAEFIYSENKKKTSGKKTPYSPGQTPTCKSQNVKKKKKVKRKKRNYSAMRKKGLKLHIGTEKKKSEGVISIRDEKKKNKEYVRERRRGGILALPPIVLEGPHRKI